MLFAYKSIRTAGDKVSFIFFQKRILFRTTFFPYFFLHKKLKPRAVICFNGFRSTFFFIISVIYDTYSRLVFSKSVRSLINLSPYSPDSIVFKERVLHPDVWSRFFFSFFKYFPMRSFFFIFMRRLNLITPYLSTVFIMARLCGVFFYPRLSYGLVKYKKRRRIKKKIRKKIFTRPLI